MRNTLHRSLHIAVLGSGRGSNFEAILKAIQRGDIPETTVRVAISNNSSAGILEIARANGIAAVHMSGRQYPSEQQFVDALLATLRSHEVNLIVLAGYMKRVPPAVIHAFRNRIINIHPALLPKFGGEGMYGMRVHEAVIAARERISGATVHLVDEEYDHGAILLQRTIPVAADETAASLAEKVLAVEHTLYPDVLRMIAGGGIRGLFPPTS